MTESQRLDLLLVARGRRGSEGFEQAVRVVATLARDALARHPEVRTAVLGASRRDAPAVRKNSDLFELFAIEVAAAVRNAQLYQRVEDQNRRLVELDEAKDDFLRGVSHNLQTPLASIRGYAQQLAADTPDRRLGIITEQADRLSRMVRQLLTVSRIESGALAAPHTEFTIASDLPKMLAAVRAAASDARWVPFGGSVKAAPLLIAEMAIAGT